MASPATFIPGSTFKSGKSIIAISRVFHEESVPSALLTSAPPGSTSASEDKDKSVVYEAGNGGGDPNHIADARLYELVMYIETRVEIRDCTADQREQVEDVLAEYRQLICDFVSKTSWTEAAKEFAESVTRLSEALNIALNNTLFGWRLRQDAGIVAINHCADMGLSFGGVDKPDEEGLMAKSVRKWFLPDDIM